MKMVINRQLFTAIEKNDVEVAESCLMNGANVHAVRGEYKETPLHEAAGYGHVEVAALLIANGADVNEIDLGCWTPLHLAANGGRAEVADLLIEKGANVNAANRDGQTPLHVAAAHGHAELACLLMVRGANVNATDDAGWTPLHYAAIYDRDYVVAVLISKGSADVSRLDKKGRTAWDLAEKKGCDAVKAVLIATEEKALLAKETVAASTMILAAGESIQVSRAKRI